MASPCWNGPCAPWLRKGLRACWSIPAGWASKYPRISASNTRMAMRCQPRSCFIRVRSKTLAARSKPLAALPVRCRSWKPCSGWPQATCLRPTLPLPAPITTALPPAPRWRISGWCPTRPTTRRATLPWVKTALRMWQTKATPNCRVTPTAPSACSKKPCLPRRGAP